MTKVFQLSKVRAWFLTIRIGIKTRLLSSNWTQSWVRPQQRRWKSARATCRWRGPWRSCWWRACFSFSEFTIALFYRIPSPTSQAARIRWRYFGANFSTPSRHFLANRKFLPCCCSFCFFASPKRNSRKWSARFCWISRIRPSPGLTTGQFGFVYGTIGIVSLLCGGLLGGMVAAKKGLKFWLWWMVLAIHLPDAVFVYLAYALPDNFWVMLRPSSNG